MESNSEKTYYFFSRINLKKAKEEKEYKFSKSVSRSSLKHQSSKLVSAQKEAFNEKILSEIKNSENISYLFDKLLKADSLSFCVFKSLFSCLFDEWDQNDLLKFIKDENNIEYEKFNSIFGECSRYKKELFSQILELFDLMDNVEEKIKVLNLIYHFLLKSIEEMKTAKPEGIILSKKIFFHLFESKLLMNKIFNLYLSNQKNIKEESFLLNIIEICNNTLEYHPKPFVFTFLKNLIQNKEQNAYFIVIFKGIADYIIKRSSF